MAGVRLGVGAGRCGKMSRSAPGEALAPLAKRLAQRLSEVARAPRRPEDVVDAVLEGALEARRVDAVVARQPEAKHGWTPAPASTRGTGLPPERAIVWEGSASHAPSDLGGFGARCVMQPRPRGVRGKGDHRGEPGRRSGRGGR